MTTRTTTRTRTGLWRLAMIAGGVTMAIGGPLHPESDAKDPLRDELATMTAGDTWVLSHSLVALGTALLAVGLWLAVRRGGWAASTMRALRIAAVAVSLYVVETLFHLAAVVDSDNLAHGHDAPVAFTHLGLAAVLYPVSGLAFAWLGLQLLRSAGWPQKVLGAVGVVGGLVHATVLPLLFALPDTELTPMFAAAGTLMAFWSLGAGLSGLGTTAVRRPGLAAPVVSAA